MRATYQTLGAITLVFLAQVFALFAGIPQSIFTFALPVEHQPWSLVLSVYAHGGVTHLLVNMIALAIVGWFVERKTTPLRFHAFFVTTGVLAALSQVAVSSVIGPANAVLGASGAIFALMGYALTGNVVVETALAAINVSTLHIAVGFLVLSGLVTLATASPGVALIAHAVGFFIGLVAGYVDLLEPASA